MNFAYINSNIRWFSLFFIFSLFIFFFFIYFFLLTCRRVDTEKPYRQSAANIATYAHGFRLCAEKPHCYQHTSNNLIQKSFLWTTLGRWRLSQVHALQAANSLPLVADPRLSPPIFDSIVEVLKPRPNRVPVLMTWSADKKKPPMPFRAILAKGAVQWVFIWRD